MTKFIGILTGNTRDPEANAKMLLTQIEPNDQLDRDHCWVLITPNIAKVAPKPHQKGRKVEFEAELTHYIKHNEKQTTLTNIQNIRRIR